MAIFGNIFGGEDAEDAEVISNYYDNYLEPYLDQLYRSKSLPYFLSSFKDTVDNCNENVVNMSHEDAKKYLLDILRHGEQNFNDNFGPSVAQIYVGVWFMSEIIDNDLSKQILKKVKRENDLIFLLKTCLMTNTNMGS